MTNNHQIIFNSAICCPIIMGRYSKTCAQNMAILKNILIMQGLHEAQ